MKLAVHGTNSEVTVSEDTFARPFNEALVHQVVTAYLAGGRSGTKAQKNRARVSGGGVKPWRQKGTGRARAGTIRSPLWRGGGVTFAAKPRDHAQKVNKKMYRGAMSAIVSELIRLDKLTVIEAFKLDKPNTKSLLTKLKDFDFEKGLIVAAELDKNLMLAARNVSNLDVEDVASLDPVALIRAEKVLITKDAVEKLQERLK